LPAQERTQFQQKYPRETLLQMKKEIYDKTLAVGKPVECEELVVVSFWWMREF
jgi:hypothetical protein